MSFDLSSAAAATGVAKSSVLRAIKAGRISAQRDDNGRWHVEPVELFKIFPPLPPTQPATHQHGVPERVTQLLEAQLAELKTALADMRQDRDRWIAEAADWKRQAQNLLPPQPRDALPTQPAQPDENPVETTGFQPPIPFATRSAAAQPSRFRRAWRWMRATGCLAGAGLLLALSTVPAGAQQQQPQQPPPPGCFTVEMSHSTQGNPQGSILLDRCTGKTWLLLCIRNDTAGCAFRWAPIPDATEPAGGQ
jgi:hypothetical protein